MRNTKRIFYSLVPALALGLTGCSGGGFAGIDNALNISGTLSLGNSSQGFEKVQSEVAMSEESVSAQSVDLTQYKVSCSTQTAPVQTATASVGADGSFNVKISGAANQPLSCSLITSNGSKAADFMISDSSKKDLNGNAQSSSTTAFKKDADLGTINFDPNAGEVTVPATNIAAAVAPVTVSAAQVFDPTGTWTIGAVDFAVPDGVKAPCANHNNCDGPPAGQSIYLKLWKGLQTSDSSDVYGLQVWDNPSQFSTCGSKIGLSSAMKTALGVDFSANGAADNEFAIATTVTGFADPISHVTSDVTVADGWKMSTAKTLYPINTKCGPHDITAGGITYSNAWVCGPDGNGAYQASLGGGCKDSLGNPVMPDSYDWQSFTNVSCQSSTTAGVTLNTCTGGTTVKNQSMTVTCTNKSAITDGSYAVNLSPNAPFDWNVVSSSQIPAGKSCSDATVFDGSSEAVKIAQLQCYSQYYYQSGMESANACLPKVDMDWSSATSANFAIVDKLRPQGLVFFEKYSPFADGSGGTLLTRQEHYNGVQVDQNSWVNCRVIEVGGLTVKKISDTKLLATYQSSQITTSLTKPACLAHFNGKRETFMFYLTK